MVASCAQAMRMDPIDANQPNNNVLSDHRLGLVLLVGSNLDQCGNLALFNFLVCRDD